MASAGEFVAGVPGMMDQMETKTPLGQDVTGKLPDLS